MARVTKAGTINLGYLLPHKDISEVASYKCEYLDDGRIVLSLFNAGGEKLQDLPPKKKLSASKNMGIMVKSATDRCWKQTKAELPNAEKEAQSQLYRQKICKLETDVLEAIVLCHKKGRFGRAQITLEAITDELTRRALLNDSSRK